MILNRDEGYSVSINAGAGNDSIRNECDSVTIDAGAGNDTVYNWDEASLSSINLGDGNDVVSNQSRRVTIRGGAGNDTIQNWGYKEGYYYETLNTASLSAIYGEDGADSIRNECSNVTIDAGAGNDTVYNWENASLTSIDLGDGNDSISNQCSQVTIRGGDGNDTIHNWGYKEGAVETLNSASLSAIDAGAGADSIRNECSNSTINAGAGNDTVFNWNTASEVLINLGDGDDTAYNLDTEFVTINGGSGADSIENSGSNVTLNGGIGNDYLGNSGSFAELNAESGNDLIRNWGADSTLNAGVGNDSIYNWDEASAVIINADDGNDFIENACENVTINGGDGDDTVLSYASNVTVDGGAGADRLIVGYTASSLTFATFESDDTLGFQDYVEHESLTSLASDDGDLILQSDHRLHLEFKGTTIDEIKDYAVDNNGEATTIKDLIVKSIFTVTPVVGGGYTISAYDDTVGSRDENYILLIGDAPDHTMQSPEDDGVSIWLNGWDGTDHDSTVRIVDASKFYGSSTIVGNDLENVLVGSNGGSSLWGGEGSENDTLIGGSEHNEFFYLKGNGNDVINNAVDGDVINLLNINLDDIDADSLVEGIDAGSITLKFNDGGSIRVNSSSEVNFRLADGSTWQAVERDSYTRHWDVK